MWYCFLLSLWLCHRPQWIIDNPQSWNLCGLTALSEIHQYITFPYFWFQSRWQSFCQGSVLLNHLAFKETLWKIPWTLWNYCLARYSIIHPPSSRVHIFCSPSLPCVYAQTCHVRHFLWENTTGPHSTYNWQRTWIWNFLDSGF